jgi:hypothetical protein
MDRTSRIIFWTILFLLIGGFALNYLCELGVKCKECPRASLSKEESVDKGFYVAQYKPLESEHNLRFHDERVTFEEIWIENGWVVNSDICLWKTVEKTKEFNATIEFKKNRENSYNFDLEGYGSGWGMGQNRKRVTILSLPDTLIVYMVEKSPRQGVGWQEKMNSDTIVFIRNKNNAR